MGEKQGGGMDYGVYEPTSSLDDSRSTSMVGAREGLARRMETDANIRDLNARIPDVQTGMPLLNNQDMSRDFLLTERAGVFNLLLTLLRVFLWVLGMLPNLHLFPHYLLVLILAGVMILG